MRCALHRSRSSSEAFLMIEDHFMSSFEWARSSPMVVVLVCGHFLKILLLLDSSLLLYQPSSHLTFSQTCHLIPYDLTLSLILFFLCDHYRSFLHSDIGSAMIASTCACLWSALFPIVCYVAYIQELLKSIISRTSASFVPSHFRSCVRERLSSGRHDNPFLNTFPPFDHKFTNSTAAHAAWHIPLLQLQHLIRHRRGAPSCSLSSPLCLPVLWALLPYRLFGIVLTHFPTHYRLTRPRRPHNNNLTPARYCYQLVHGMGSA